jgi:tRNA1(Val) A37 N6-methylase TrmN6
LIEVFDATDDEGNAACISGNIRVVLIGSITTSLGKQTVIDRGVGIAIAPVASAQKLSIGHVIGTELER